MRTNEAPKKLWINPSIDLPKLNGVIDKNSIQYVRADAFIEKACEIISDKVENYINFYGDNDYSFDKQGFIKRFKKAMEE